MPKVSVIIPTYKHPGTVLETLSSVFAQTFSDYEVVVVNDGSPDHTGELLKPLEAAGKIRLIEQANAGQAAARNHGVAESHGEYIAMLDDDDLWPPDKLAWQVEALEKQPGAVAVGGALLFLQDGKLTLHEEHRQPANTVEWFAGNVFISPGQTLIRRRALEEVGPLDASLSGSDDWDLWIRLSRVGAVTFDPRVALHYRIHAGNASRDIERMYRNTLEVIHRNAPTLPASERRQAEKLGHLFAYEYVGQQLLKRVKEEGASGRLSPAIRLLRVLSPSFAAAASDPRLARRMVVDSLPAGLVRMARGVKNTILTKSAPARITHNP